MANRLTSATLSRFGCRFRKGHPIRSLGFVELSTNSLNGAHCLGNRSLPKQSASLGGSMKAIAYYRVSTAVQGGSGLGL